MEDISRNIILNEHNHKIWLEKDGRWATSFDDPNKKRGTRIVRRKTKEEIENYIFNYYTGNIKPKPKKHLSINKYHYKEIEFRDVQKGRYVVTSDGEIYDCINSEWVIPKINHPKGRYKGLSNVTLYNEDGKKMFYSVAQITLTAWTGPPQENMKEPSVDHIDSDSLNNTFTNLRWMEKRVNSAIRKSRGVGEENSRAILTENDVIHICNLFVKGDVDIGKIAEKYNVSESAINNIYERKTWTHLTKYYEW